MLRYYANYLESHGYDSESQEREARRSGACAVPWPSYIQGEVPIAPETVPPEARDRIAALKRGAYQWPACRPILFTGLAGGGKTQLSKYIAKEAQCPYMNTSAAGFLSSKGSSGVETVAEIFKRSRIRSEMSMWWLRLRQLFALLTGQRRPRKKPAIVFIDEFDSIGKPAGSRVLEGDMNLEVERNKTLARLLWEIAHNEYVQGHLQAQRCPPADFPEQWSYLVDGALSRNVVRAKQRGIDLNDEYFSEKVLAQEKRSLLWRYFLGRSKAETLVVAATNSSADELDPEVQQWFEIVEVQPFDAVKRRAVIGFHGQNKRFQDPGILDRLAERSDGYSADKLASILNDAALLSAERDGVIRQADIDQAIEELDGQV
jgi:SpoVK/Ycf46/Vps4 family AAA+-type ATPase